MESKTGPVWGSGEEIKRRDRKVNMMEILCTYV
jgi:hypothetical protein